MVSLEKDGTIPTLRVEGVSTPRDVSTWIRYKLAKYNWNIKGVHAIFMAISSKEFKHASMCDTSKEAWDILEITHEGTNTMKNLKLQNVDH